MDIPHISNAQDCGVLLTQLRMASGKSTRALALDSGLNPASLLQWQKGLHMPTLPKLAIILHYYGQTVTFGYPPPDPEQETLS